MASTDADLKDQQSKDMFSTLMENGKWLYSKGEFKKAIDSFTNALALKPCDKSCFVGRARCYLKVGQFENTLRDAEASLKSDKSFSEGLYMKAEALHYMGEFEFALVFYHRAYNLRPKTEKFRLGMQKAQEAIENSVGSPSSVKLEIKGDLSCFSKGGERTQPIAAIQNLTNEKKQMTPKSENTTKNLLGEFCSDKKFLENLMKDEGLINGTTKDGEQLKDIIQSSLSCLDTCAEFWHQEKPISVQDRTQKVMQVVQQQSTKRRHSAPSDPARFLMKSLDEIDAELMSGNAEGCLKKAEEVMKIAQRWSDKEIPNKKEVLDSLHSCIGNALVDVGDKYKALEHHQKELELAKCKLPGAMSSALDNIGRVYVQTGQFARAIEVWEKKLPLVCGDLEKTWLLHEIGLCYLELDRHKEARDYGTRSVAAADGVADKKWQMNANVLVAQSELKLGNYESCVTHFKRALSYARLLEDNSAMDAVEKALNEAKQHRTREPLQWRQLKVRLENKTEDD
ncbi:outer dynein arm-docking complex subunit 4 [Archocentrus centrarchus]|uniref:outer dynein arm-docking complex subunit 4 n=1 Tax=Archocentrus centrarchus TaxID=63155 RepID=UPI0011EA183E|nr:tetratricopeptide repeat protein 25 [Archocentrus centrarchus]